MFFIICQGWLKCEDTACGTRVQKLPLMFQRGHPMCPTCQRGVLHQEVKLLIRLADASENQQSAYAKTKAQTSFTVTTRLIISFVFDTGIVQFLYFLNPKFPAPSHLLCLCSLVCVGNPNCWFSHLKVQMSWIVIITNI